MSILCYRERRTPAFFAGRKPKDVIISIDGKSTSGMSIEEAVKLIRGKKGTKVLIGLKRRDKLGLERSTQSTFSSLDRNRLSILAMIVEYT